jgi:RNA polymerase sigma-70 factor (ECF subfamily)
LAAVEGAVRAGATTQDLYSQYGKQIYAFCLHKLRSREEAEDAVQTTFMNAFRSLQRGATTQFEQAWLFKIAQNVCFARQTSSSRRLRLEAPNDFEVLQEIVPAQDGEQPLELFGLEEALEQMPENQRRAILLREWQGLSYREIGEELELSQAAVEMLIFRARRALAGALEQPEETRSKKVRAGRRVGALGSLLGGVLKTLFGGGAAIKVVSIAAAAIAVVGESASHTIVRHSAAATAAPVPAVAAQASASPTSRARVTAREASGVAASTPAAARAQRPEAPRAHGSVVQAQTFASRRAHSTSRARTDDSSTVAAAAPPSFAPPPSTPAPAPAPAPAAPPRKDDHPAPPVTPPASPPAAPAASDDHGYKKAPPVVVVPPAPVVQPPAETAPVPPPPVAAAPEVDPGNSGNGNAYGHDKQKDKQPDPPAAAPAVTVAAATPPAPTASDDQGNGDGRGNGNGNGRGHNK